MTCVGDVDQSAPFCKEETCKGQKHFSTKTQQKNIYYVNNITTSQTHHNSCRKSTSLEPIRDKTR